MSRYRGSYNLSRNPPAPAIEAVLRNPVTGEQTSLKLLVDTGFDGTLIIEHEIYEKLRLYYTMVDEDAYAVHGGLLPVKLTVFLVEIEIPEVLRTIVKAYAHPRMPRSLMGRELLNAFNIHLYGPSQIIIVEQPGNSRITNAGNSSDPQR